MDDVMAVALVIREYSVCGLHHQDRGNCFCDDTRFEGDSAYRVECDCKIMAAKIIEELAARHSVNLEAK
jgi:hypothetical protein